MNNFGRFNHELGLFADELLLASPHILESMDFSTSPLNAQYLNKQLRALVPIEELRSAGSFFTCDELGATASNCFKGNLNKPSLIFDPACGVGNLLIACSKKMDVNHDSLIDTLSNWGMKLAGCDIHKEFIEAAKIRLILEAVKRGVTPDSNNIEQLKSMFHFIKVQDSLKEKSLFETASHIIINPPYFKTHLPESCKWGTGTGNSAAVFMEKCIKHSQKGTQIVAILPDVLRSGTRYKKWRGLISKTTKLDLKLVGRFDAKTDVDVFLLFGEKVDGKQSNSAFIKQAASIHNKTIKDCFLVSTGPVVPYRDKEEGPEFCYISPGLLAGKVNIHTDQITSRRKYPGTLFLPPFVVVRRTSSPSDNPRARATIIRGNQLVAVENHLIVLKPESGYVQDCKKLIKVLANPVTDNFLNHRIRCRHLTVSAIKDIPLIGESI